MTDVAKYLPQDSPVVTAIYAWHKQQGDAEPSRGYCGASEIGHPCERYLWYEFRNCCEEDVSGRVYRLFETGDLAEPRFTAELRAIGCTVHEVDSNGEQFAVYDHGGHFSGHMDSAILGVPGAEKTWHVGEYKTHSAKSFMKLKKYGVRKSKPVHYAQMQTYTHKTGMKRALYLAVNKDTDELYAERIRYDKEFSEDLMERARRIITSNTPPPRLSERPDWYECKWCSAQSLCHGTAESALPIPSVSCRQCCYATPTMDGNATWRCTMQCRGLCEADQDKACSHHLILPGLLFGCEPSDHGRNDAGSMWIDFVKEGGELFRHGREKGGYSTNELRTLPLSGLSAPFVTEAKRLFGAEVTEYSPDDIIGRYPDGGIVWRGAAHELASAWKKRYSEDIDLTKALGTCRDTDYCAAELPGGRAIFHHLPGSQKCEIRENAV